MMPDRHASTWTAAELALLGTDTDRAIGERIGRTTRAVETQRALHGIAPHVMHRREWSRAELALRGKMTDRALAEQMGVAYATVYLSRRKAGIPAFYAENSPLLRAKKAKKTRVSGVSWRNRKAAK